jgi:hypothetical protein
MGSVGSGCRVVKFSKPVHGCRLGVVKTPGFDLWVRCRDIARIKLQIVVGMPPVWFIVIFVSKLSDTLD